MYLVRTAFCIVLVWIIAASCTKKGIHEAVPAGEGVVIYLTNLERQEGNCEIDLSTIQPSGNPMVNNREIISYNSKTHTFKLADSALQRFGNQQIGYGKSALIVTVDSQVVYAGWMWASIFSSTCNEVVFFINDPIHNSAPNELQVNFGYPYEAFAAGRPDLRNANLLIDRLRKEGKLVK